MVKRRQRASDEIMLIPFLDILCSLIGVLILIIVVLCVAQTQRVSGRTPEEIARAEDQLRLRKQKTENERINALLADKAPQLEKLRTQATEKEQQLAKIRKLLATSAADRDREKELHQNLTKELDNLLVELSGLAAQEPELKTQIAALEEELKKRQVAQAGPPVIVQPGGSGLAKGTKVFFIEGSGTQLAFYWDERTKGIVSAVPETIATDVAFNAYLKAVLGVPQSKIIFLLRDDGMGAYYNAAGWAQGTYGYKTEQIGKLPIPGHGEIDLRMFKDFLGTLTPPPEKKAEPPPPPQRRKSDPHGPTQT